MSGIRALGLEGKIVGRIHLFALIAVWVTASPAHAIITMGATGRNLLPPTGTLADSGWQYEGYAGSYTGTAISSNTFITAQHVGDMLGGNFLFDGVNYPITAESKDPASDLVVYTVNGTLPTYAPLYGSMYKQPGQSFVMYGRGDDRGAPIVVNGSLKGWRWGAGDNTLSWGTGTISANYGSLYGWLFNNNGDTNEGQVAAGDSGGGVFVDDAGVWKLAGIINSVEEKFSTDGVNPIDAAIFDKTGLYESFGPFWTKIADTGSAQPASGYATSIAANNTFVMHAINATLVPEPTATCLLFGGSVLFLNRRRGKR